MRKFAVLTDSACDIPAEMQKKYNIDILSFTITVDGKSYVERVDFTNEQYYDMLTKCTDIPKTSQITMMRFEEQFEAYLAAGIEDVLYVSINSGGSNTHSAALMARQNFLEAHPGCPMHITIVDSHTYSMTYGWFVCEAAKKLAGGADMHTVVEYLEDAFARMEVALSVFTLRFIKKSGRISAAAAFAGELLGLRPIITMIDGETATAAKVRGDNAVMPALVAHVKKRIAPGALYLVGGTDKENCKQLAKLCKKELGHAPEMIFELGAAVATNTGPNAVAVVFLGEKRR